MKNRMKWSWSIILLACLPLLFELTFIGSLSGLLEKIDQSTVRRSRDLNIAYRSTELIRALIDRGAAVLLCFKAPQLVPPDFKKICEDKLALALGNMKEAVKGDAKGEAYLARSIQIDRQLEKNVGARWGAKDRNRAAGQSELDTAAELLRLAQTHMQERVVAANAESAEEQRLRLFMQYLVGGFLCLSFGFAFFTTIPLSRSLSHKIKHLHDNSQRLLQGKYLLPPLPGKDEFADLDAAFRNMANLLQESKAKESALIAAATDLICAVSEDGVCTMASPASRAILGHAPEAMKEHELIEFVAPEDRQQFVATISGATSAQMEMRLIHSSGRLVDSLWSMNWSETDRTFFCVAQDITESKEAARQRELMVSMVSHDLRTPLTSVQLSLDSFLARKCGVLSAEETAMIETAGKHAERVVQYVTDLLDIERLSFGELPLDVRKTALQSLIDEAIGSCADDLRVEAEPTDVSVFADERQATKVLRNLIPCASSLSRGGETVKVRAYRENAVANVQISFSGEDIPEEVCRVVFDRFGDKHLVAEFPNLAKWRLALCLSKQIVQAHQGEIGLSADDGVGLIWFTLPASTR